MLAGATSKARMGDDIKMISNPEAAAVDAFETLMDEDVEEHFKVNRGDNVLVCHSSMTAADATTYAVGKSKDSLEEAVAGEGNQSGANVIDEALERQMTRKFGSNFTKL
ncbi:hypothetical protein K469DRAFT_692786 [Zopfia rhizophila CBS 207.26]|uniref:Uncharacterized protein n=1 Tax=Zopfia rhizophila CBS 207.26 TaxID=1314779 RepID=A0A6A6DNH9_9PEZI|nr:hypothetical protein K469DRAFT_692786 [Zopfia rhizophila CBS 207.26]